MTKEQFKIIKALNIKMLIPANANLNRKCIACYQLVETNHIKATICYDCYLHGAPKRITRAERILKTLSDAHIEIVYYVIGNWGFERFHNDDNYSKIGGIASDLGWEVTTVSNIIFDLCVLELIQLDVQMLQDCNMQWYYPTALGKEVYNQLESDMFDDEPSYNCICRGAGACIQCNPRMFI